MGKTAFDFLIIGAQKAGTTTLHQLLSEHPGVFVPPGKEVPFYNRDGVTDATNAAFFEEHFASVPEDVLLGKATPHYLLDPVAARAIARFAPKAKLVVILRDPVERAFSHYRMSFRRGFDTRSFAEAATHMLAQDDLAEARGLRVEQSSQHRTYIAWSEYGRLLTPYADAIAEGRMLILSTRALAEAPADTMATLLAYLGLDRVDLPSLGEKLHQGGSRERLPIQRVARALGPLRWLWRQIPRRIRSRVLFRVDQWNVVQSTETLDTVPADVLARLRAHFAADTEVLERLTGWSADWQK